MKGTEKKTIFFMLSLKLYPILLDCYVWNVASDFCLNFFPFKDKQRSFMLMFFLSFSCIKMFFLEKIYGWTKEEVVWRWKWWRICMLNGKY